MDGRICQKMLKILQLKVVNITGFLSPKSINLQLFTLILFGVGVRCDVDVFRLTASVQSIYREIYDRAFVVQLTREQRVLSSLHHAVNKRTESFIEPSSCS